MIIVSAGSKGGCTKTTFATNLTVSFQKRDIDVALLDIDPSQNGFTFCQQWRPAAGLPAIPAEALTGNIAQKLKAMDAERDVVIVDCGGMDSAEMNVALSLAHLVYFPIKASGYDILSLTSLNSRIADIKAINPNMQAYVLLGEAETNRNSRNSRNAKDAVAEMCGQLQWASPPIYQAAIYRSLPLEGKGVVEGSNAAAKHNFNGITDTVIGHIQQILNPVGVS